MAVKTAKTAEETAAAEKTGTVAESATVEEAEQIVYVGPTLPAGKLKCNRVMIGTRTEIREELKEVLKEYPLVEKMLVPVSQLAEKKDKVRTPGNIMHKYYTDIVSVIAAKEKESEV